MTGRTGRTGSTGGRYGRRRRAAPAGAGLLAPVALVALVALVSGCGEDPPPPSVEFGAAKPTGAKLGIEPGNGDGGQVPLSQWPDACKLLSDGEIRAILPQAENIGRKPVKVSILNMNPLAEAPPGTTGDVPRGGCEFEFGLPSGEGQDTDGNSSFTVTVTALADPALVAERYREDKKDDSEEKGFTDLDDSWGAQGCYTVGDSLSTAGADCHQGAYLFEAGGSSLADGVAPRPGPDAEPSENTAAEQKRRRIWRDKVLSQVVRTAAARMS